MNTSHLNHIYYIIGGGASFNTERNMKMTEVIFTSGELELEGVLGLPDGEAPFPAVVVCHPHPLNGGRVS
jgi:hypothetical protein